MNFFSSSITSGVSLIEQDSAAQYASVALSTVSDCNFDTYGTGQSTFLKIKSVLEKNEDDSSIHSFSSLRRMKHRRKLLTLLICLA